jgi:hypothetical protein
MLRYLGHGLIAIKSADGQWNILNISTSRPSFTHRVLAKQVLSLVQCPLTGAVATSDSSGRISIYTFRRADDARKAATIAATASAAASAVAAKKSRPAKTATSVSTNAPLPYEDHSQEWRSPHMSSSTITLVAISTVYTTVTAWPPPANTTPLSWTRRGIFNKVEILSWLGDAHIVVRIGHHGICVMNVNPSTGTSVPFDHGSTIRPVFAIHGSVNFSRLHFPSNEYQYSDCVPLSHRPPSMIDDCSRMITHTDDMITGWHLSSMLKMAKRVITASSFQSSLLTSSQFSSDDNKGGAISSTWSSSQWWIRVRLTPQTNHGSRVDHELGTPSSLALPSPIPLIMDPVTAVLLTKERAYEWSTRAPTNVFPSSGGSGMVPWDAWQLIPPNYLMGTIITGEILIYDTRTGVELNRWQVDGVPVIKSTVMRYGVDEVRAIAEWILVSLNSVLPLPLLAIIGSYLI